MRSSILGLAWAALADLDAECFGVQPRAVGPSQRALQAAGGVRPLVSGQYGEFGGGLASYASPFLPFFLRRRCSFSGPIPQKDSHHYGGFILPLSARFLRHHFARCGEKGIVGTASRRAFQRGWLVASYEAVVRSSSPGLSACADQPCGK